MLQETLARLQGLDIARAIVVAGDDHRFLVAEQLREHGVDADILLEPEGKNTAPAIALAAYQVLAHRGLEDAVLLVLAADHVIGDADAFRKAVNQAKELAAAGSMVTFGIEPLEPATGYGYIRKGEPDPASGSFRVAEFVEKPDLEVARSYVQSGDYLWNSGMFMFRVDVYLRELNNLRPDIAEPCRRAVELRRMDLDFIRVDQEAFSASGSESVDYAVMEKTTSAMAVPLNAQWNDVGSWSSLWDVSEKDGHGNVFKSRVIQRDSKECLVHGDDRLVVLLGLEKMIVVDTKDALLVAASDRAQDIKDVVAQLQRDGTGEDQLHRMVYRPWGNYDSVDSGERYQVKRITVKPGAKLSLQKHQHRAEHWIIVAGRAQVTRDQEVFMLEENESTFIPQGAIHSLENPGKQPLEVIEVQSGSYLGEDDIIRYEDRYGRS